MINVQLLQATMFRLLEAPENWNQEVWISEHPDDIPEGNRSGLVMDFAAHAAVLAGSLIDPKPGSWDFPGVGKFIDTQAQRALGLTDEQADDLFDMNNSLEDLQRVVGSLIEMEDLRVS